MWEIAGICAGIFIILVIIQKISGSQTPVRSVILSMLVGILALTAVNLCSGFTNVSVPVSLFSLAVICFGNTRSDHAFDSANDIIALDTDNKICYSI